MPEDQLASQPSLRDLLLEVLAENNSKPIMFNDLDEVPVHSIGDLRTNAFITHDVLKAERGWIHNGEYLKLVPDMEYRFNSYSGPANNARLAQLLEEALLPKNHLLVRIEAGIEVDSGDWELSQPPSHYAVLSSPQILGHGLNDYLLAHLHFEVENGTLGESDVYQDFEKQVGKISEQAATELRERKILDPLELVPFGHQVPPIIGAASDEPVIAVSDSSKDLPGRDDD